MRKQNSSKKKRRPLTPAEIERMRRLNSLSPEQRRRLKAEEEYTRKVIESMMMYQTIRMLGL